MNNTRRCCQLQASILDHLPNHSAPERDRERERERREGGGIGLVDYATKYLTEVY